MFYLPRKLFVVCGCLAALLTLIHWVAQPAQNSWYAVVLGVSALFTFLTVYLFPIVKKLQLFKRWKNYKFWVNYHIYAIFISWVIALFHTGFAVDSFFFEVFTAGSLLVLVSGMAGQYFFIKIPRTRSGLEESKTEIINVQENIARTLLKQAIDDPNLFEYMEKVDGYIRDAALISRKDLLGLITNDIRMMLVRRRFRKDMIAEGQLNPKAQEYESQILARLTIEMKIANMSIAKNIINKWTSFHTGAIYAYTLIIAVHVVSKLLTVQFYELNFWNFQ